jgi:hypothetical protein
MYKSVVTVCSAVVLSLGLSGCFTTGHQSPQQAAASATQVFNGQDSHLVWVENNRHSLAGSLATAMITHAGLDSPVVSYIHDALAPAARSDRRVAISGPDSKFAARAAVAALNASHAPLPRLQLAFVGSPADAQLVRVAVEAKGGKFVQAMPRGS